MALVCQHPGHNLDELEAQWRFLIVRANGRVAIELERERNRATAEVIRILPNNCELLVYEPRGRLRVIRMLGSAASPTATGDVLPATMNDLVDEG